MRGITISRSYIRLIDDEGHQEDFYIGSEFWDQLRKAITTAKRMKRLHQGGLKTIVIRESSRGKCKLWEKRETTLSE